MPAENKVEFHPWSRPKAYLLALVHELRKLALIASLSFFLIDVSSFNVGGLGFSRVHDLDVQLDED